MQSDLKEEPDIFHVSCLGKWANSRIDNLSLMGQRFRGLGGSSDWRQSDFMFSNRVEILCHDALMIHLYFLFQKAYKMNKPNFVSCWLEKKILKAQLFGSFLKFFCYLPGFL